MLFLHRVILVAILQPYRNAEQCRSGLQHTLTDIDSPCSFVRSELKLPRTGFIWYEHALTLQHNMEEHQHFGVEEGGPDAVMVTLKQAQLLVFASILGKQPLRMPLGNKGVSPSMPCSIS